MGLGGDHNGVLRGCEKAEVHASAVTSVTGFIEARPDCGSSPNAQWRGKDSEISFAAPNQENRDRHHYNILGFPWWCAHQSPHRSRAPNTGFSSFAHARPGKRQRTHSCRSQARRIGVIVIACHSSPSSNCLMRWCYAVMCTRVSVGSALPLTTLATQAARALRSTLHRSYLWVDKLDERLLRSLPSS